MPEKFPVVATELQTLDYEPLIANESIVVR